MQIRFQPDAEAELAEARVWYALHREGLDDALTQRIDETLNRIARAPYAYPVVYRKLRRAVVHKFPLRFFTNRPSLRSLCLRFIIQVVIMRN